eukprot:231122_1
MYDDFMNSRRLLKQLTSSILHPATRDMQSQMRISPKVDKLCTVLRSILLHIQPRSVCKAIFTLVHASLNVQQFALVSSSKSGSDSSTLPECLTDPNSSLSICGGSYRSRNLEISVKCLIMIDSAIIHGQIAGQYSSGSSGSTVSLEIKISEFLDIESVMTGHISVSSFRNLGDFLQRFCNSLTKRLISPLGPSSNDPTLLGIPPDLITNVFDFLSAIDLVSFSRACGIGRAYGADQNLWKIYCNRELDLPVVKLNKHHWKNEYVSHYLKKKNKHDALEQYQRVYFRPRLPIYPLHPFPELDPIFPGSRDPRWPFPRLPDPDVYPGLPGPNVFPRPNPVLPRHPFGGGSGGGGFPGFGRF